MNRRGLVIIIILVFILLLAGGVFWAYRIQNRQEVEQVQTQPEIKKVLDESVLFPVPAYDNENIWYFSQNNRLFRINADGGGLSEFALPAYNGTIKKILWPSVGSDFIIVGNANENSGPIPKEIKTYYNSAAKAYVSHRENIQSMDWLPDGKRVVYIWKSADNTNQSLVLANADGTGFRTIAAVFWSDLAVKASPDGKNVLMYRSGIQGDINKIYLANIETGEISTAVDLGKTTGAMWIPGTNKFLYIQSDTSTYPKLYVHDVDTKASTYLNLRSTLDKVVPDKEGKYLYVAVQKQGSTKDVFVKFDLSTLVQENYFEPVEDLRVTNLMLLGNTVYFINTRDGKLYTINK